MNLLLTSYNSLLGFLRSPHAKQTSILFGSQIVVLLFGVLLKSIQTRNLTVEEYGTYAFFGSITSFLFIFFRFGYFNSTKVLLAEAKDESSVRSLIGSGVIIALIIGALFSISLVALSFFVDHVFNVEIGHLLLLFGPFCFVLPYRMFINEVGIGSNKINAVGLFEVFSAGLFLASLYIALQTYTLSLSILLLLNLVSVTVAILIALGMLKPKFTDVPENIRIIHKKNKEYGFKYYSGAVVNQSTFKLDELCISYFVNVAQLGFYTLANIICSPISYLSSALSKSYFKKMASEDRIPKKLVMINVLWLISSIVVLYFLAEWIVVYLFGEGYENVALYIIPLSMAHLFQGLYAPFSFLSAKSKGKEIRNVAYFEAAVNVVGNLSLIPLYGVYGAIAASILARALHFFGLRYYYRKLIRNNEL